MQALAVYGRLLARAIFTGISSELQHPSQSLTSYAPNKLSASELHLVAASSGIAKNHSPAQVLKKWNFGDDACFVAGHKLADVLGVADGVGGWRSYGVDPSQFPKSLMATCERLVREGHFQPQSPLEILAGSYYEMLENKTSLVGSCTACVVSLHKQEQTLYTTNLGDSGFLLIREGLVVHRSEEQQHYFNAPFQLAVAPTVLQGLVHSDSPDSAQSTSIEVQEGDVILVGTDGLFDNMNDEMILYHINKLRDHQQASVQKVANSIAHQAHQLAFDPDYMSPFALSAAANGIVIKGGKPDDITVLLARVTGEDPNT